MSSFSRRFAGLATSGATVAALVISPVPGAGAADTTTLTLLNINDFHGRISTSIAMGLANTIQTERAAAPDGSLLLSAGDNVGASLYVSSVQKDQPTLDYLNALGLSASAVGNHEFDAGMDDLVNRIIPASSFTYLGANVLQADGTPALEPYYTTEVNGTTVAVIGAVTTETPQLTDPSALASVQFTDPIEAVNKYATQLSDGDAANGEADVIIAEYHEGVDTSAPEADAIINQTSAAVDAIFTGHTHAEYIIDGAVPGQAGKTRPVIQTGNYGDNLGKVVLTLDADKNVTAYSADLVKRMDAPTAEQIAADPVLADVNAIVTEANAYATEQGSVVAGQVSAPITTGFDSAKETQGGFDMRNYESTMGHLVADMYLAAANSTGRTPADIGIVNPGGLRDELPGGLRTSLGLAANQNVRVMDIVNVTPFANNLWTTELTGAQLKTVLEEQWQQTAAGEMATRPYLQLGFSSNVTYTYTGSPDAAGYATRGSNVLDVYVNGKRVEDADTYTVAIPSFLLGGGDNFGTLSQGANAKDTALVDSDAFVAYFKNAGTVEPNFAKQAVRVADLAESYDVNGPLAFSLSDLNVRSYGVPALTELKVTVGGIEVGTVAVAADGTAAVSLDLAGMGITNGSHEIVLADATGATGTTVRLSANFTGTVAEPTPAPTEEPISVAPSTTPSEEPTSTETASAPTAAPSTKTPSPVSAAVVPSPSPTVFEYENCAAVWDALGRPIQSDEAGFHRGLDSDGDGTGCEVSPDYPAQAEDGSDISASGSAGSTSGSAGSSLAHTGFTASVLAGVGALALLAGGVALVVSRRKAKNI
ncbi:5'-nucleotidase C-terminal domain-containing protein [Rothia nasisuis]|uniref:5'-nucleotidase C-terminal domain-containing protein n=1 Tax=Rothia nasisuis TaxID=2109647 RepID=UPI001F014F73|nr:5'-nucleotidase C-terminal domain-containing protein [Rothia nasisuis]